MKWIADQQRKAQMWLNIYCLVLKHFIVILHQNKELDDFFSPELEIDIELCLVGEDGWYPMIQLKREYLK